MADEFVNTRTGEVVTGLAMPRKHRYPRDVEFMTMFRDGWKYLATLDLAGRDTRVLFKLLEMLDYENFISIGQETIAQEVQSDIANVNRSIAKLEKLGVIERERDKADKRRWAYRLNAELGWKGDAKQWNDHMHRRARQRGSNVIPLRGVVTLRDPNTPDMFNGEIG